MKLRLLLTLTLHTRVALIRLVFVRERIYFVFHVGKNNRTSRLINAKTDMIDFRDKLQPFKYNYIFSLQV